MQAGTKCWLLTRPPLLCKRSTCSSGAIWNGHEKSKQPHTLLSSQANHQPHLSHNAPQVTSWGTLLQPSIFASSEANLELSSLAHTCLLLTRHFPRKTVRVILPKFTPAYLTLTPSSLGCSALRGLQATHGPDQPPQQPWASSAEQQKRVWWFSISWPHVG